MRLCAGNSTFLILAPLLSPCYRLLLLPLPWNADVTGSGAAIWQTWDNHALCLAVISLLCNARGFYCLGCDDPSDFTILRSSLLQAAPRL